MFYTYSLLSTKQCFTPILGYSKSSVVINKFKKEKKWKLWKFLNKNPSIEVKV